MSLSHPLPWFRLVASATLAAIVLATGATMVSWTAPRATLTPADAVSQVSALNPGQVELTPAGPYSSGQAIQVRVQAGTGRVVQLNAGICPDSIDVTKVADVSYRNANCAQIVPIDGVRAPSGTYPADGSGVVELTLRAPLGLATATTGTGTFPCDIDHPCRVPYSVQTAQGAVDSVDSIRLTYLASNDNQVVGACGPGVPGETVRAAAPDRLSRQWVTWTVAQCNQKPPATSTSFGDESLALTQFSAGGVDLAYAGTPDTSAGFVPPPARKATYIPVGLNAMSVGLLSHVNVESSVPNFPASKALTGFTMTAPELASLVSPDAPDGLSRIGSPLELEFARRNPNYLAKGDNRSFAPTAALAGPAATTLFLSRYLSTRAPDQFAYPAISSKYGDQAGKPFGTFADFNSLANNQALLSLAIGVPSLKKSVYDATADVTSRDALVSLRTFAYLADTATLSQLDLEPVALPSSDGAFLTPTAASMQAAVPAMTASPEGTLEPAARTTAAGAYPLTYVEYAVVPADPIECAKATPIVDWLRWVSSTGQDHLTGGIAPLPADLRKQASDRLDVMAASCIKPQGQAPPAPAPAPGTAPGTAPLTSPDSTPLSAPSPTGTDGGVAPGGFGDNGAVPPATGAPSGDLAGGGSSSGNFPATGDFGSTGSDTFGSTGSNALGSTGSDTFGSTGSDTFGSTGSDAFGSTGSDAFGSTGSNALGSTGSDTFGSIGGVDSGSARTDPTGAGAPAVAAAPSGRVAVANPVKAKAVVAEVKIPTFGSPIGPSVMMPILAVPLVGGLLSGAAWLSAGNSIGVGGALGRTRRRLAAGRARPAP